jgi:hypothetical protein
MNQVLQHYLAGGNLRADGAANEAVSLILRAPLPAGRIKSSRITSV